MRVGKTKQRFGWVDQSFRWADPHFWLDQLKNDRVEATKFLVITIKILVRANKICGQRYQFFGQQCLI